MKALGAIGYLKGPWPLLENVCFREAFSETPGGVGVVHAVSSSAASQIPSPWASLCFFPFMLSLEAGWERCALRRAHLAFMVFCDGPHQLIDFPSCKHPCQHCAPLFHSPGGGFPCSCPGSSSPSEDLPPLGHLCEMRALP